MDKVISFFAPIANNPNIWHLGFPDLHYRSVDNGEHEEIVYSFKLYHGNFQKIDDFLTYTFIYSSKKTAKSVEFYLEKYRNIWQQIRWSVPADILPVISGKKRRGQIFQMHLNMYPSFFNPGQQSRLTSMASEIAVTKKNYKQIQKYKKLEVFEQKNQKDIMQSMANLASKFADLIKDQVVVYRFKVNSRRNIGRLKPKQIKNHSKV